MCGACDISCKYAMDMDVLEPINAIRMSVESAPTGFGKNGPSLRKHGPMVLGSRVGGPGPRV